MKKGRSNGHGLGHGRSERFLKTVAVIVSLLFAAVMLYPLLFAISSSMKDNAKIYEVPPKILPDPATSHTRVWDYRGMNFGNDEQQTEFMRPDSV